MTRQDALTIVYLLWLIAVGLFAVNRIAPGWLIALLALGSVAIGYDLVVL